MPECGQDPSVGPLGTGCKPPPRGPFAHSGMFSSARLKPLSRTAIRPHADLFKGESMALAVHIQNHLVVASLALRALVDEMESIATRGIAQSGTGRRLTPLPPEEWERMSGPLRRIVAEARELAEEHAPDRLREYETCGPIGQTRSWLSIQLGR